MHVPSLAKVRQPGSGRTQTPEMEQKLYPTMQIMQRFVDELKERQFRDLPLLPTHWPFWREDPKPQERQFPEKSTFTQ
jgi:hypothetical protein